MNKEEPKLIVFSPEVENAISSVISSNDPLDAPDFDPIEYINNKFPDENSLNKLKSYRENLDEAIIKLDRDINEAVKQQSTAGKEAEEELERAKGAIETLCDKINEIHDKANQSEVMVEDICKDIKKLDIAKKHLSSSTAALERLQMLVKSLDELESYCINRDYEKASTVISAVNEISKVFKEYESVKKIKDIEDRVRDIKNKFGIIILADFSEIESINKDFIDVDDPEYEEIENLKMKLKYACLVLDHLDKSIKMELINKFSNNQLQAYGQMFYPAVSKQESNFKNVIRRFTFFKKVLKKYGNIYEAIFPTHWKMKARLCIQFLLITRKHYEMMLKPREEFKDNGEIMKVEQHIDIGEMITALKQSIVFERKAMSLFDDENDNEFDDDDDDVGNASDRIRRKLKAKNKQKNKDNDKENEEEEEEEDIDKLQSPEGMITNVFEDYMNDYIMLKENILNNIVDSSLDDKGLMNNGGLYVLSSFQNILKTVRAVIQECSTLNTGKIFYEIYQRIVLCLMNYCETLNKRLPQPKTSSNYGGDYYVMKNKEDYTFICNILNTGEAVADISPSIDKLIVRSINEKYQDEIKLEDSINEKYYELCSSCITILVKSVVYDLENSFDKMVSKNWNSSNDSKEEVSDYVEDMRSVLNDRIPSIRLNLSNTYFRSFCDKFLNEFIPRYNNSIFKFKKISEKGSEQLLIDFTEIKNILSKLPLMNLREEEKDDDLTIPSIYTRLVNKLLTRSEIYIKLLGVPIDRVCENFLIMLSDGSGDELNKILIIRGLGNRERLEMIKQSGLKVEESGNKFSKLFTF